MSREEEMDLDDSDLRKVIKMVWGDNVKEDIFLRWTCGFNFSTDEPTALVQCEGGPCAILAAVQAHILKHIILNKKEDDNWREVDSEEQNKLLIHAACEILNKAYGGVQYQLVYCDKTILSNDEESPSHNYFHKRLRILTLFDMKEVEEFYIDKTEILKDTYGVLVFLYSVLCSRGLAVVQYEMNGSVDPLIDCNHGYGSQVLTNIMITGNAVDNVFNDNCELDGLTLFGIVKQSDIGFLTLLEHLRYCEVGSYLKKPHYPVWVLGSETHLTVLFSFDRRLANCESKSDIGRRVFSRYDPDGNDFIKSEDLAHVLRDLNLVSDEDYVKIMADKLDSERLGIILKSSFMDEFFQEDKNTYPDTFKLYHYNGQFNSNIGGKVVYHIGTAALLECNISCIDERDSLITCIQTRWPSIDIQWDSKTPPSLN